MNIIRKAYCRTFQTVFRIAIPILPYRKPEILEGIDSVARLFRKKGIKRALLVTDKSIRDFGITKGLEEDLKTHGIRCYVYDRTVANPTTDNVEEARILYLKGNCQAIIGFGGGSSIDCAKAVGARIAKPYQTLSQMKGILKVHKRIPPLIAIPTTAGTGSETTQYAVFTLHKQGTKNGAMQKAFAHVAFLDAKYTESLSDKVTVNTAIDALTHLIEGYTSKKSNFLGDLMAEDGMRIFAECIPAIRELKFTPEIREKLILMSTIAGIVIAQAGTSLPHACGYMPTYEKHIPHGRANAIFTRAYLELFPDQTKTNNILRILGFNSLEELNGFFKEVLEPREEFTEADVERYTDALMATPGKLALHPYPLTREDIYGLYKKSLILY